MIVYHTNVVFTDIVGNVWGNIAFSILGAPRPYEGVAGFIDAILDNKKRYNKYLKLFLRIRPNLSLA